MEVQFVREFVTLVESRDIAEAADRHYLSPSVLSMHIRRLEEELGKKLFDRTGRALILNDDGKLFLPYARNIIMAYDRYVEEAGKTVKERMRRTRIGISGSWAKLVSEDIVSEFYRENGDVRLIIMYRDNLQTLYEFLAKGQVDYVFSYNDGFSEANMISMPLLEDTLAVVIPAEHKLAQKETVTCADLRNERILMQNAERGLFHKVTEYFSKVREPLNMAFAVNNEERLVEMLEYGAGTGLMLKQNAERLASSRLVVRELSPQLGFTLFLQYRGADQMSRAEGIFLEYIRRKFYPGRIIRQERQRE